MFSSAILDVVIGLVFCFLTVSLMASAVVEAISSFLKWRSKHLLEGIKQLVNDPGFTGLALLLYQHAAVNPRGILTADALAKDPKAIDSDAMPAYVDGKQFAAALMDILKLTDESAPGAVAGSTVGSMKTALDDQLTLRKAAPPTPVQNVAAQPVQAAPAPPIQDDPQLHQLLTGIVRRCEGNIKSIQAEIAAWFDNGMDRLSGAYKRRTQLVSFVVALLLSIVVNVDAIRVVHILWDHPALADDLKAPSAVAKSLAAMERSSPSLPSASPLAAAPAVPPANPPAAATVSPPAAVPPSPVATPLVGASANEKGSDKDAAAAADLLKVLDEHLPLGWVGQENQPKDDWSWWLSKILGLLITAVASLFGAPFWFDVLQSVTRLKGTGPSPKDNKSGRAAAG